MYVPAVAAAWRGGGHAAATYRAILAEAQQPGGSYGQQVGVTRPGANKEDRHGSTFRSARSVTIHSPYSDVLVAPIISTVFMPTPPVESSPSVVVTLL